MKIVYALALALISTHVFADSQLAISLHAGGSETTDSNYSTHEVTQGISLGVVSNNWLARAGYSHLGDSRREHTDTMLRVDIAGPHIDVQYRVVDAFLDLYLGGGVYYHRLETRYYDFTLAKTHEFNPYANLILSRDIVAFFALQIETKYLWDVGGRDMIGLGVNAQFKF